MSCSLNPRSGPWTAISRFTVATDVHPSRSSARFEPAYLPSLSRHSPKCDGGRRAISIRGAGSGGRSRLDLGMLLAPEITEVVGHLDWALFLRKRRRARVRAGYGSQGREPSRLLFQRFEAVAIPGVLHIPARGGQLRAQGIGPGPVLDLLRDPGSGGATSRCCGPGWGSSQLDISVYRIYPLDGNTGRLTLRA